MVLVFSKLGYHQDVFVRSPRLSISNVVHAFSTRQGGASGGVWAELNLAFTVGDSPDAVVENRRRFAQEAGFDLEPGFAEASQVHGIRVVEADADGVRSGALSATEADALVTEEVGLPVAVRTADCAPVLVAALDEAGAPRAVAAIHAGWRGACAGVIARAIDALEKKGLQPRRMIAAVGPMIGPDAFEVSEDVVEQAKASLSHGDPRWVPGPRGRPFLDLPDLVVQQLKERGLPREQIHGMALCTHGNPARFYSHRRDHGQTGRHLSAIQIRR